ncbi:hypothetical protein HMPREF1988_00464 [Porphyromonas gingivalis F0185]|nr:hypothetical protein HMPREF1988_00464 [Porphyromonas gingivalis F0185]
MLSLGHTESRYPCIEPIKAKDCIGRKIHPEISIVKNCSMPDTQRYRVCPQHTIAKNGDFHSPLSPFFFPFLPIGTDSL